jgi:hypothetical protein
MSRLARLAAKAKEGEDIRAALDEHALSEVAELVLLLHQNQARAAGAILSDHMMRSYMSRSESERAGMRAAVEHVIVALVLLEVIDPPGSE